MKPTELRQKARNELHKRLKEKREKLRQLSFNLASGKVKNVREIRKIRKDIARMITIIKEKDVIK